MVGTQINSILFSKGKKKTIVEEHMLFWVGLGFSSQHQNNKLIQYSGKKKPLKERTLIIFQRIFFY
jgi:hypothetical protein